jgi:hypothetical protein
MPPPARPIASARLGAARSPMPNVQTRSAPYSTSKKPGALLRHEVQRYHAILRRAVIARRPKVADFTIYGCGISARLTPVAYPAGPIYSAARPPPAIRHRYSNACPSAYPESGEVHARLAHVRIEICLTRGILSMKALFPLGGVLLLGLVASTPVPAGHSRRPLRASQ